MQWTALCHTVTNRAARKSGGCRDMLAVNMCMFVEQLMMWCKPVGACLQASGGTKKLSQFPTRVVVCPHCLEGMMFEEAQIHRHFHIVSQMQRLALLCLALQRICPDSLSA